MANTHQVLFVKRQEDPRLPIPKITHIGGRLKEGAEWSIPSEEAISGIQSGRFQFFIETNSGEVEQVVVARHRQLGPYLKSELDNTKPETLLNMPEKLT